MEKNMRKLLYSVVICALIVIVYFLIHGITNKSKLGENNSDNTIKNVQAFIEQTLNTHAEFFPDEGVFKVSFPRKDIKATIDNWPLDPFMGLTSWVAFQKGMQNGSKIMAMGDLVLLEDEVNPVMSAALNNNIQITALHNHFLHDNPKVYFMHLEAEGTMQEVAQGIRTVFDTIKNVLQKTKNLLPTTHAITGEPLEKIISVKGAAKEGMFKIVIGRQIQAGCGCMVGKNMGVNTWIAFGGTDDNAFIDGDFAILEDELQPVLKSLINANIHIVAIHNHMINEKPRMLFLHFWAQGAAIDLARGIKNALDKTTTLGQNMNAKEIAPDSHCKHEHE